MPPALAGSVRRRREAVGMWRTATEKAAPRGRQQASLRSLINRRHAHDMATPKKLLAALRKHIDSLNVPYREVERRAGLPSGTIVKLLAGKMHLRVRHIVLIGGVFGISIFELFCVAYGPKGGPERLAFLFAAVVLGEEAARALFAGKLDKREWEKRFNLKVEE